MSSPNVDDTAIYFRTDSPPCLPYSVRVWTPRPMPPSTAVKSMFPERLKDRREELELTQKEVGERVGTTNSAVSKWEEGSREPQFTTLIRLAGVLHVSVEWLIGTDGAPTPPRPHLRLEEGRRLVRCAREIVEALVSLLPDGDEQEEAERRLAAGAPDARRQSAPGLPTRPAAKRRGRP
jgi:transcriptional regulator with XRE-family HTH domain